ncbi:mechanosensitive ion channel [Lysobacter sp. KIS68-7]|uniref:mechanosensitive ion channel family protein n=1 Tax=Lysobacter sp. KIS68-7 TaxID=2904252 RepID=UPI001E2EC3C7|nr:mechanosensitive ion channel domain-containing protein [Lysobacter sp. KIS68-7]UHQ18264.1 mechanosensitive ion channel [Lysobacter sp. KIS68-7]
MSKRALLSLTFATLACMACGAAFAQGAALRNALTAPAAATTTAQGAGTKDLAARIQALRAVIDPAAESLSEDRADFLRRQLLASLERREDMAQSIRDVARLAQQPSATKVPPPQSVLALDDQRRELQRLEQELAGGLRRRALLQEERDASAQMLTQKLSAQRALVDAGAAPATLEVARLETELVETSTAEIDQMLALIDVQQHLAQAQHDAIATRLSHVDARKISVTAQDEATIDARIRARGDELRRRMAVSAIARERARAELLRASPATPPLRLEALKERVANADIDLELAREALTNLATEQAVWQTVLRHYRDRDPSALVEAHKLGPVLKERLERRRDFLRAMSEQVLARTGALDTEIEQAPNAPDVADKRMLRDVFDARLQMVHRAQYDEGRVADMIERVRADFDQGMRMAPWQERARVAWAMMRDGVSRFWNFELFTVQETVEVDGRQTEVPRGVTVGKVVKAPLLLVFGLFAAIKLTAWWERWLHRRRGVEEGNARLLRRWVLALLIAAAVLASLAIAGIPFAAFAFIGGAVAIGIGFGMQALFKNLISGVLVLIERPFRLGDVIEVGALRGTVVDIDLRTSVIRDADGADTLIPNSVLMEENVKNVTYRSRMHHQVLDVVVDGDSDSRAVGDAMLAAAARHGQLADDPEPTVLLDEFADNGLRFALHYWIELRPGTDRRRIASDLRLMILGAFADAGIRMAPPPPTYR